MSEPSGVWEIAVDTGGTFTDALGTAPDGAIHRAKVLSSSAIRGVIRAIHQEGSGRELTIHPGQPWPRDFPAGFRLRLLSGSSEEGGAEPPRVEKYDPEERRLTLSRPVPGCRTGDRLELLCPEEAPVLAARLLTGTPGGASLPPCRFRLATTLGTNALLERKGAPTALFITAGFADILRIGTQARPELFTLDIRKPLPLYRKVVEVEERLGPDGGVEVPLKLDALEPAAAAARKAGCRSAAVALLHSYRNRNHEEQVRKLLLSCGFDHVSCSADLAPMIRILPRAETAVVDACLAPVIRNYLDRVSACLENTGFHVLTSAGGLARAPDYRPKDSLLSGPAGGVVGAAHAGRMSGAERILSFDMGGTSTDVARFDGDFDYAFEHRIGDAHLVAPALAIETVAAGGSSICRFDGRRIQVGPESAGADPGPACYGAGGPLTLTDVNLLTGRIDPSLFQIPIDVKAAETALGTLLERLEATGLPSERNAVLNGILAIADERMADAIRRISLRKGYDPTEYALVAFGGAGPQHACGVASRIGVRRVIIPPDTGLLSAEGLRRAVLERFAFRQVLLPLSECLEQVTAMVSTLESEARDALAREGVPPGGMKIRRRIAELRFSGQDAGLEVEMKTTAALEPAFLDRYKERFGHLPEGRDVELVSITVAASSLPEQAGSEPQRRSDPPRRFPPPSEGRSVLRRDRLGPGDRVDGPALILESHSVTVVERHWTAQVDPALSLILKPDGSEPATGERNAESHEAVRLELFTRRFESIAGEMGEQLRRTAVSTNVKERLDFSCAVLDPDGELLVNAPHIPVHLGAIGLCVRSVRDALPFGPGDVVVTNHPAYGGSHLPDITVISPVFAKAEAGDGPALLGYVANRSHHAELGGTRPGSMPPSARNLAEEGVVIPPTYLFRNGEPDWKGIESILSRGPYPSRAVRDNLADLRAAVAANREGAEALASLAARYGRKTVLRYMRELSDLAADQVRGALAALPPGEYTARQELDDGSPLAVRIRLTRSSAVIDFSGSGPVHSGNMNATPAIVRSVVIYFLRLLVRKPIPLNEGFLQPVELVIPKGILNPDFPEDPARAPAVVGGNVETSQRLVDTLTCALKIAGCSQGTMNNVLFGTGRFGYYETICGGCGAGPGFPGADAVHSHMTNTRITDPEILEHRYPVRVERFAVRRGSGGNGRFPGGDGAIRELRFLEPVLLSVVSQHRTEGPFGMDGGQPGLPGRQRILRADGGELELGPVDEADLGPGDRFLLETPGGGGYGEPPAD